MYISFHENDGAVYSTITVGFFNIYDSFVFVFFLLLWAFLYSYLYCSVVFHTLVAHGGLTWIFLTIIKSVRENEWENHISTSGELTTAVILKEFTLNLANIALFLNI